MLLQNSVSGKVEILFHTNRRYPVYLPIDYIMFQRNFCPSAGCLVTTPPPARSRRFSVICCRNPVTSLISAGKCNAPRLNRLVID